MRFFFLLINFLDIFVLVEMNHYFHEMLKDKEINKVIKLFLFDII